MPVRDDEMQEIRDSLRDLHHKVDDVDTVMRDIRAEIGPTLPDITLREGRLTMQARLHVLESDSAAAKLAREHFKAIQQARDETLEAERRAKDQRWTRMQKAGLFVFAAIGAAGTVVSVTILLLGGTPAG